MKLLPNACRPLCSVASLSLLMLGMGGSPAAILTEGVFAPLLGTSSFLRPELAGTVIEDRVRPFTIGLPTGGTITGTIQDRVVRQDGSGTLDFYWHVSSGPNSAGQVAFFRLGEFLTDTYDADYRIDSVGDIAPDQAYLFDGVLSGQGYVNFRVLLDPGQSSLFMFLSTSATHYGDVAIMDVATPGTFEISETLSTYAPVPEPTAVALLGLGVLSLTVLRRHHRMKM